MNTYINVTKSKNKLYHKFINNGIRYQELIDYSPSLFFKTDKPSKYKSMINRYNLNKVTYNSMKEYYDVIREYRDISSVIYGNIDPVNQFLAENYKHASVNLNDLRILYIDIETTYQPGIFPSTEEAIEEITAITIFDSLANKYFVLVNKPIDMERINSITYATDLKANNKIDVEIEVIVNSSEKKMLKKFVDIWTSNLYPDLVVGYNSEKFDIPYLYSRIRNLLGNPSILSPVNYSSAKIKKEQIKPGWFDEYFNVELYGINHIDYMKFYKKMVLTPRKSYSLDNIAYEEIGSNKVEHAYKNLMDLYEKDYTGYVIYNIIDVELIRKINDKRRLLEIATTKAYIANVNYADSYSPSIEWESIIYNMTLEDDIILEPKFENSERPDDVGLSEFQLKEFIYTLDDVLNKEDRDKVTSVDKQDLYKLTTGAFVKIPKPGLYRDVASWDVTSLYPSLMIELNMGPETMWIPGKYEPLFLREILRNQYNGDHELFLQNCFVTPNKVYFYKHVPSYFARKLQEFYKLRAYTKNELLRNKKQELKEIENELLKRSQT